MDGQISNPLKKVAIYSQVEIELTCETGVEKLTVTIVPDHQADFSSGFLGENTPLSQAVLGQEVGQTLSYHAGDVRAIKILSINQAIILPEEDHDTRRKELIRKAVEQIERTNAMIFASSFSGKWGDYDPEGIQHWDKEDKNSS